MVVIYSRAMPYVNNFPGTAGFSDFGLRLGSAIEATHARVASFYVS
jgi:hypothetical protein